jgi:hypothetical protein
VLFRVRDSGAGIDPAAMAHIFEPYTQMGRDAEDKGGAWARVGDSPANRRAARRDSERRQRGSRARQRVPRPATLYAFYSSRRLLRIAQAAPLVEAMPRSGAEARNEWFPT